MDYCVCVAASDFKVIKSAAGKDVTDEDGEFKFHVEAMYQTGEHAWFVCINKIDAEHLAKKWRGIRVAEPGSTTRI